ncbi:Na-translocating system protein MpsC family protein [Virgibacillus sp. LDC-1]|uniref:Na-translocating system protein MpsC family protein n=1 Tax=Virgibacillus sp. LDC-1 TaxID=3039856 RepID=UPI0024DE3A2B|nr:Na-translocating system protein MpsC family protein [Virgibacillus sp. LDC-1]
MKNLESQISSSVGKLLRSYFGKGPRTIYVSVSNKFITIYLQHFLAPMEQVLLKQNSLVKVQETRDIMMEELVPELKVLLSTQIQMPVQQLYYDWDLEKESGIIFAELTEKQNEEKLQVSLDYDAKEKVHEEIARFTKKAQKTPRNIVSYRLNERTIISKREDILVLIEKELIRTGFREQLRLTKRRLEKNLLNREFIESVLQQKIQDVFVDWDFEKNIGYIVFILEKEEIGGNV